MPDFYKLFEEKAKSELEIDIKDLKLDNYDNTNDKRYLHANREFYANYIIESHLIYYMKQLVDEHNESDKIIDDRFVLKFDCLVSEFLELFYDIYCQLIELSNHLDDDKYIELQKSIKIDDERFFIDPNIKKKYYNDISYYSDYDYIDNEFFTKSEIQRLLSNSNKKVYNLLREFFSCFNMGIDYDLKLKYIDYVNMKYSENYIVNLSFYLCLSKTILINYINRVKNDIIINKVFKDIEKVYKNNDAINEFNSLKGYLNINIKKKHEEYWTESENGKRCFSIMKSDNNNYFALSGVDNQMDKGIQQFGSELNKIVFNNEYIYAHMISCVKRYVSLHKKGENYDILEIPICLNNDNAARVNNQIGYAYGCCERKMLAWYEDKEINSSNKDKLVFYIKYLPCENCIPALEKYKNIEVYSLFKNYADMINYLNDTSTKIEIKKAKNHTYYFF